MSRLGFPVGLALCVAVVSVSTSAPLIAYAAAPPLALAFWRNALSLAVLAPAAAARGRARFVDLVTRDRRTLVVCVLSGLALAVHFGTWVPSAKLTTVATATALVCTTPIWSAVIATAQGTRLPRLTWIGIAVAVAGAILATGADFAESGSPAGRAVLGDVLALIGGVAGAVYFALGERARAVVSTTVYSTTVYSVCALALLVVCLVTGTEMVHFPATAWLAIVGTTVFPQLLGHTMVNYALQHVSATTVNVLLLLEVPGATLLGWLLIDQLPEARSVPGLAILTVGVAVVMIGAARASRAPAMRDAAQRPTSRSP